MPNLLDLLFPKLCIGCSRFGSYFCTNCISGIKQTDLVCPICERPSIGGKTHPLCTKRYGLDGLWSLGVYEGNLRKAIQKLKYRFAYKFADTLIDIVINYWAIYQPALLERIKKDRGVGWIIVPVPLHKRRQNWRGFNQSAELGKILSKKLGLEYQDLLIRTRYTKPQVGLDSRSRRKNIQGAFSLTKSSKLETKNCILIDDVWTTGSTLKECTYILKRGGVKTVWALTIAR